MRERFWNAHTENPNLLRKKVVSAKIKGKGARVGFFKIGKHVSYLIHNITILREENQSVKVIHEAISNLASLNAAVSCLFSYFLLFIITALTLRII